MEDCVVDNWRLMDGHRRAIRLVVLVEAHKESNMEKRAGISDK